MEKKNEDVVCILCKHFRFEEYHSGYSEWTPGWEASIICQKGVYDHSLNDISEKEYRKALIDSPKKCGMYERRVE